MNTWATLVGTLVVDRKPIPVPKLKRPSRAMTDLTRKEICALANAAMVEKRKELRSKTKEKIYGATISPISAQGVVDTTGITKTHVRKILLELIDEGLLIRTKGSLGIYYYERA